MMRFEEIVPEYMPNLVLVCGDANSTVAAALVCNHLGIPVGMSRSAFVPSTGQCPKRRTAC